MLVVRIFLSDAYFMQLICLAIHLEPVCVTCSLKLKVESITTAKSLAVGTGNSSLPRGDTLKLLGNFSSIQILVT